MKHYLPTLLAAALAWAVLPSACRCGESTTTPPDAGEDTTHATTSTVESSTSTQSTPTPPPQPDFEQVTKLGRAAGWWGEGEGEEAPEGPWVFIESREVAIELKQVWKLPYPWRLQARMEGQEVAYDCGLFEKLNEDAWRVGYCLGGPFTGKGRTATRVYLQRKEGMGVDHLRVTIGDVTTIFDRKQ